MKKLLIKLSLVIVLILALVYAEAAYLAPNRFKTRLETVYSSQLPASFEDVSIAIISNLEGDIDALNKSVDALNKTGAEIVIIMGNTYGNTMDEEYLLAFNKVLSSIKPKYGKIALVDIETERQGLKTLGYHVITNESIKLHTTSNETINLIGHNEINEHAVPDSESFTILLQDAQGIPNLDGIHLMINVLDKDKLVSIPFLLNPYHQSQSLGNTSVFTHTRTDTNTDYRLFTNAEILIITLKSQ